MLWRSSFNRSRTGWQSQAADALSKCVPCGSSATCQRSLAAAVVPQQYSSTMQGYAVRSVAGWTTIVLLAMLTAQTQTAEGQLAFDWGRPCTLVGTAAANQVVPSCGKCGSGAMASNATKTTCTFKDIVIPPSSSIAFSYNGNSHHLYMAPTPCTYTTEICADKNASAFTTASPCTYTFPASGVFYVSDKTKHYCEDYSANLKVTVT